MSVYTIATLGYPDNQVRFNDYTLPVIYRTITRLPQHFDMRSQDIPIPFESGVSDFKTLLGSANYMLQGKMYPSSEDTYDSGLAALRDVANLDLDQGDINSGNVFNNNGYVSYQWGDASGNLTKQIFVKPLFLQAAENTRQGFVLPFTIYCKVKDPTIYGTTLKTASTIDGTPGNTTGSAAYPFAYPIAFGATYYTVTATATNNGTVGTYPQSIDIYGPVTTPRITNGATGEYIEVAVTLNSSSDHLQIQYAKDYLAVTLNGVSVLNKVSSASTYFKIQPGGNGISLTGSSISAGSYASVNYYDGYSFA
jgi:Phage tail protein